MNTWFRLYNEVLDDPKVQKLPLSLFKHWINILCIASKNDGTLPPVCDIAFGLRAPEKETINVLVQLEKQGLVDFNDGCWAPHNWGERQFKSDTSTERVKRFRKRHETVSGNAPDTEQNRADTEQKKDTPFIPPSEILEPGHDEQSRRKPRLPLPDPWDPGEANFHYARNLGLDPDRILADIREWATNASTAKARKSDWSLFWQGWCRREADRAGGSVNGSQPRGNGSRPTGFVASAARAAARAHLRRSDH